MDRSLCLIVIAAIGLIGCSKAKTIGHVFPEEKTQECADSADPYRYIVRWEDGRITNEVGNGRDQFIEEFVEPRLHEIERVEHDRRIRLNNRVVEQSHQLAGWGIQNIGAEAAWNQGVEGEGVVVAVIDSGLDREHTLLRDRLAINPGEMGLDTFGQDKSSNGLDDDKNGFVDDWAGYDFVARSGAVGDESGHGTHVAGIIAAEPAVLTGGATVQGVAPKAKVLPLDFIDYDGGYLSDAIEAIKYAVKQKVDIINASWGGPDCSKILSDTIAALVHHNILFIAAAGNDGIDIDLNPRYPASYPFLSQITVGAISPYNAMTNFSNYGRNSVHIFAPGSEILSTAPGNQFMFMSGTSMATPFVSGAMALLKSYRPKAKLAELREALFTGVSKNPYYANSSQGRLNVELALQALGSRN